MYPRILLLTVLLISIIVVFSQSPPLDPNDDDDPENKFGPIETSPPINNLDMRCVYYNRTECTTSGKGCGLPDFQLCNSRMTKYPTKLCFAVWTNNTEDGVVMSDGGCFLGDIMTCGGRRPRKKLEVCNAFTGSGTRNNRKHHFCCCQGVLCNAVVGLEPIPAESTKKPESPSLNRKLPTTTLYIFIGLAILFVFTVSTVYLYINYCSGQKHKKPEPEDVLNLSDFGSSSLQLGYLGLSPITLKEVIAQGNFGTVWSAVDGGEELIAVKVFSSENQSSWRTEKAVFSLPQFKHPNVLAYLGAEVHLLEDRLTTEYWLMTEYHQFGSLSNYLKTHTVTLKQLLTIVHGISAGLMHLHEYQPPTDTELAKPPIAHRDFKSTNILLSDDFRVCIADFGLSMVFHQNGRLKHLQDSYGRVGTHRYMAPEVLEGAINFNCESFIRIDMYAYGLVIWELLSRCCFDDTITCAEYQLPFEAEIGIQSTIEDLRVLVSQERKRPPLANAWLEHPILAVIVSCAKECWEHESEARLNAATVYQRIERIFEEEEQVKAANVSMTSDVTIEVVGAVEPVDADVSLVSPVETSLDGVDVK